MELSFSWALKQTTKRNTTSENIFSKIQITEHYLLGVLQDEVSKDSTYYFLISLQKQ